MAVSEPRDSSQLWHEMQGFGVHTLPLVDDTGVPVFVKFHWQPKLGGLCIGQFWEEAVKESPELIRTSTGVTWEAIEAGEYPEWELGLQIFTEEQAERLQLRHPRCHEDRPSKNWSRSSGPPSGWVLNRNPDNFFAETEQVASAQRTSCGNPDFTNDPLLAGRIHSYVDTQISRLGGPNFHELPINAPIAQVHDDQRDGMHRQAIHRGRVAYRAIHWRAVVLFQAGAAQGFAGVARRIDAKNADKVRIKPEGGPLHGAAVFQEPALGGGKGTHRQRIPLRTLEGDGAGDPRANGRELAQCRTRTGDPPRARPGDGSAAPFPRRWENPATPEIESSPALSLGWRGQATAASARARLQSSSPTASKENRCAARVGFRCGRGGARLGRGFAPTPASAAGEFQRQCETMENSRAFCSTPWCFQTEKMPWRVWTRTRTHSNSCASQYWHCRDHFGFRRIASAARRSADSVDDA